MTSLSSNPRPAPIRTDHTNPFANNTMKVRVPKILREVQALNPDYSPEIQRALDVLHDNVANGEPIPLIDLPAPDFDSWTDAYTIRHSETWHSTEWFFAETFFYRHLIQAVRWWETGRDPFAPKKTEEIASTALWETLQRVLEEQHASVEDRLAAAFQHALWGNRIDLSFAASMAHGSAWVTDDLLADDRPTVIEQLLTTRGAVDVICDNTGTELAMDLALVDSLLSTVADTVTLHVKMHPTFVSDVIPADVWILLREMTAGNRGARVCALAERLVTAFTVGRLRLMPDLYWNSSVFMWDMPSRIRESLKNAALVVIKGDANYRRLLGDAIWPPEIPFSSVVNYFPAPVVALRTAKSDPVVGLPPGLADQLDNADKDWRTNGRRGMIQHAGAVGSQSRPR
jgi:uncharacterized protein with ATP-grasp and redox domains